MFKFPSFQSLPLWLKLVVAGLIVSGSVKIIDYFSTIDQILQGR